jgi:hypothetical protein
LGFYELFGDSFTAAFGEFFASDFLSSDFFEFPVAVDA